MQKIRAILLDFDGTSLQKDQVYISLKNKRALWKALDQGIEIIPCTGRSADMMPPQIDQEKRIRSLVTPNFFPAASMVIRAPFCPHSMPKTNLSRSCNAAKAVMNPGV